MSNGMATTPLSPAVPLEPVGVQRHIPLAPHQLIERTTPQRDLFTIAHYGIARVDVSSWQLEIGGLVERPCRLTFEEIRQLPKCGVETFHQCAGFPKKPDTATRRIANVVWSGVDLEQLLLSAGIRPEAQFLWSCGLDQGTFDGMAGGFYQKDMPLARLAQGGVILAYEINGETLTPEHGFPLRLVIPGYYGTNAVKWLYRLELADRRANGIFTTVLYNDPVPPSESGSVGMKRPVWDAPPESAIVSPPPGVLLSRDGVEIWGWAWAANGVSCVEISTDGGSNWSRASIEQRSQWSWQRFAFHWTPTVVGSFKLMARAMDTAGAIQPMYRARNAVHVVTVEVAD